MSIPWILETQMRFKIYAQARDSGHQQLLAMLILQYIFVLPTCINELTQNYAFAEA